MISEKILKFEGSLALQVKMQMKMKRKREKKIQTNKNIWAKVSQGCKGN